MDISSNDTTFDSVVGDGFVPSTDIEFSTLQAIMSALAFVLVYAWVGSFKGIGAHFLYKKKVDLVPTLLAVIATIVIILAYRYVTYFYQKNIQKKPGV
jgi:hypothetical protein